MSSSDIYEMMVMHYLGSAEGRSFDEAYVDSQAARLGQTTTTLWQTLKAAARAEADRLR